MASQHLRQFKETSCALVQLRTERVKLRTRHPYRLPDVIRGLKLATDYFRDVIDVDDVQQDSLFTMDDTFERD